MANTIKVKAVGTDHKVVLWERDDAHPNGEVMITNHADKHDGKGEVIEVAETATVKRLLAEGVLVKASTPIAPALPKKE